MRTRAMPCDAVTIVAHSRPSSDRRASSRHRAPIGRGDVVYPAYWVAAAALIVATLVGLPLGQPAAVVVATIVFISGGLPHGAYDIALLRRAVALDRSGAGLAGGGLARVGLTGDGLVRVGLVVGGYVATALLMVSLWLTVPLVALVLFLAVAAVHFGEDWAMLEEPLLRVAAGAAVIGAATIGHPSAVSGVFVAMSDPRAAVVARIVTAIAPVALLVTLVGIALAWRQGSRHWAGAMAVCLGLLIMLPPVAVARDGGAAVRRRDPRLVGRARHRTVAVRPELGGAGVPIAGVGGGPASAAVTLARTTAGPRVLR